MQVLWYPDLDLENMETTQNPFNKSPHSPTVYKTVDFFKTEAFNKTREYVEALYRREQERVLSRLNQKKRRTNFLFHAVISLTGRWFPRTIP